MQDTFICGDLCLCIVGSIFSFLRRHRSLVLSCLTAFATFKLHIAEGGGKKNPPKTIGGKQSLQLWIRCLFPTALTNTSSMFLALSCGAVQVRHRWGTCAGQCQLLRAGGQLCAQSTSHSGVPSTPANQTLPCSSLLLFFGGIISSWCEAGIVHSLALWSLQYCLSFSWYQLLDDSSRAATVLTKQRGRWYFKSGVMAGRQLKPFP